MTPPHIELGITIQESGQYGPYQDSRIAGTVEAASREEAHEKLSRWRGYTLLKERDSKAWCQDWLDGLWFLEWLEELRELSPGLWHYKINQPYTG